MQAERIINAITSALLAGEFYPRLRDPDTRQVTLDATAVNPSGVVVGETSSRSVRATRNRQVDRDEIAGWQFTAQVRFDREVSPWSFEESLRQSPITLNADTVNGYPFVRVKLVSSTYMQPVFGQPEHGTLISMVFEAVQAPQ